ncbi:hypothetical protein SERLADRAFT_415804 [Serpula lacrymans var. lacrymans S7.9]|uniref:Uncharacterized protein n=1 Tax=Serpula lacrymans var. lacrymans (strain S7.9) TaxID=578457 RepID=F8NVN1_SERL9|nr:uncharacterized protein SERLADRAFT_415804 [Serpula lacrymans var. lacrymans S7.9]EGO24869.1 hypothetical protein SERLADRAFT_415804 [Serpula lacrymans var. lacrymans S7.9]
MSLSEEEEDAYHRTQDQKVIENIGDFDPSKRSMLPNALAMVTLEKAWIKKEFKDIRNRDILRLPSQIRETKEKSQSHKELVVKSAWNKEYTGEMHTLLFDNINAMNRRSTYSGFASIVQSSGTGKSRMVHEQAKLVFTLPFNLRIMPYPGPDNNVRQFLVGFLSNPGGQGVSMAKINITLFLGKIYQLAAERLSLLLNGGRMKRQELAERWYNYLQAKGNRSTLYEAALKGTKEYLLHSVSSCKNNGEDIKSKTKEWLVKLVGTITEHITDDVPDDQCVKVMLYFDEAHALIPSSDQEPQINVLEVLQSCLADTHRRAHFALFLSTVSKLQDFAPVQHLANSARARVPGPLQAPITEVPFDCWSGLPICPHLYKLGDLSKIRFMARFGRPLYWALLNESVPDTKIVGRNVPEKLPPVEKQLKEIIVLLDVRLLLNYELYRDMTINHEANLVASHMRMNYSIPETREYLRSSYSSEFILAEAAARNLEMYCDNFTVILKALENEFKSGLLDKGAMGELVARLLLIFAYDRAIRNSYSTKPQNYSQGVRLIDFLKALFSETWMDEIMRCIPDNVSSEVTLKDMFKESYIRFTHFGKMVDDTGTTTEAMYAAFLRGMAIITRDNQQGVDIMIPILMWDKELCEYVMTAILIQVKWRICAGSINAYLINQRDINLFPDDCISKEVQNDVQSDPYFEFTLERPRENSGEPVRPYISLILELGVQPKLPRGSGINSQVYKNLAKKTAPRVVQSVQIVERGSHSTAKRQKLDHLDTLSKIHVIKGGKIRHHHDLHPRYNIFAYGCSSTVYRAIDGTDKNVLAKLLRIHDLLAEHPRQDSRSLEAVRRMKPFWSAGEPSYHWLESNLLNPKNAMNVDEEDEGGQLAGFVVTGSMEDTDTSAYDDVFET